MTRILPDKETLEREYLAGASFTQLGEKYGVKKKVVYNTMIRRARAAGTTWPLKQRDPNWRQKAAKKQSVERHDSVTSVMIRLEIIDIQAKTGVSQAALAKAAGLSPSAVSDVVNGRRPRIQRKTAEAIMAEVERLEKAYNRRQQALNALNARRRKIAAEKAAGIRPPSQKDIQMMRRTA